MAKTTAFTEPSRRRVLQGLIGVGLCGFPAVSRATTSIAPSELSKVIGAHKGRIVAAHFWATWCGPCHRVFPVLNDLAKTHPKTLRVLGLSIDRDNRRLQAWLAENPTDWLDYRVDSSTTDIAAAMSELGAKFRGAVPYTAFFDSKGRFFTHLQGAQPASRYQDVVSSQVRPIAPGQWIVGADGKLVPVQ